MQSVSPILIALARRRNPRFLLIFVYALSM
jgi:hypothetical protein